MKKTVKTRRGSVIVGGKYRSDFLSYKNIMLEREGITRSSINNAERIASAGYELVSAKYTYDKNKATWSLAATFLRRLDNHKVEHEFKGFSIGYHGEGSRGMMEFSDIFHLNLDAEKVFGKKPTPDSGSFPISFLT